MVTFLRGEPIAAELCERISTSCGVALHTELYHSLQEMLSFVNTPASFRPQTVRL